MEDLSGSHVQMFDLEQLEFLFIKCELVGFSKLLFCIARRYL